MALEPGRYELTASPHGRFADSKPVVVTAPARGVRLVVRRIREVTGRVTGGTLHRAVGSWWVGDSMTFVVIGPDGTFEQKCLPPGRWRVEVRAGGKTTGVDFDLAPGAGRVDLVLAIPE